jgi:hypothetical protein
VTKGLAFAKMAMSRLLVLREHPLEPEVFAPELLDWPGMFHCRLLAPGFELAFDAKRIIFCSRGAIGGMLGKNSASALAVYSWKPIVSPVYRRPRYGSTTRLGHCYSRDYR